MPHNIGPMREAPASLPTPDKGAEPKLKVNQIQGNILPGFLKDFETLLFLRIDDEQACKLWLKKIIPLIATADEVLAFNRLFKAIRFRRGKESNAVKATWVNIAFSYNALKRLTEGTDGDLSKKDFTDQAFRNGLAKQSESGFLGDPTDEGAEGHPSNWVVGGPDKEADILLIIQSDDREDLLDQVEQIEDTIYALRRDGKHVSSGVHVLCKEHGTNLPGALAGHEHFGFLDGVSQPGIRGIVSDNPTDVLTPRQNPREKGQGKPGQDLLWPGEFVFGYEYQDPTKDVSDPSDDQTETEISISGNQQKIVLHRGKVSDAGPIWAENGSFLVFRRLRQDVEAFHSFLKEQAENLQLDPTFLGAKVVGRWPSGAPILRTAEADNPDLGSNDCANNDFEFFKQDVSLNNPPDQPPPDTIPPVGTDNQCRPPRIFDASRGDRAGLTCPAFGHIRKAYPRDDITPEGIAVNHDADDSTKSDNSERFTQTHRLLRRGLPYGPVSHSTPSAPVSDEVDRGLLFICYQTSIDGQFEFVMRNWVNNPNFKDRGVGFDMVIGQNGNGGENRVRTAKLLLDTPQGNKEVVLDTSKEKVKDWVIPTGGGYFFAPSISALEDPLSK